MKQDSKANYSRFKARRYWKSLYWENMPTEIEVHHKDGDPMNNDLDNLTILTYDDHCAYHGKRFPRPGKKRVTLVDTLRELEGWLTIFNDR